MLEKLPHSKEVKEEHRSDIIVDGNDDIKVSLAKCCSPIRGDKIVGYITKGQGITIHNINCPNIASEKERLIAVKWNEQLDNNYFADIEIEVLTGHNYLLDIIGLASTKNINVDGVKTREESMSTYYVLTLKIRNIKELDNIMIAIKQLKFVKNVERVINR